MGRIPFRLRSGRVAGQPADREAWRSLIGSLLQVSYRRACRRILEFLAKHYGLESSIWLQPAGKEFEMAATFGEFADRPIRIGISPDDKRIRSAVNPSGSPNSTR